MTPAMIRSMSVNEENMQIHELEAAFEEELATTCSCRRSSILFGRKAAAVAAGAIGTGNRDPQLTVLDDS